MKKKLIVAAGLSVLLAGPVLSGCASSIEKPTRQLSRAESYIEVAQNKDGQQYSAAALQRARDKLKAANKASANGDNERALMLATEAELDAQFAVAQTDRMQAEKSLREVQASLDTLRRETTRSTIN